MRVTEITCDRCKTTIDGEMSVVELTAIGLLKPLGKADLCRVCGEQLREWLKTTQTKEPTR